MDFQLSLTPLPSVPLVHSKVTPNTPPQTRPVIPSQQGPRTYFAKGSLAQNLEELKLGWVSLFTASLDMVCDGDLLEDALILTKGQSW